MTLQFPTSGPPTSGPPPLITALIPAYDAAATIERALASVFAQNYPALEIIVVDDGSTDDTASIARRYEGRGVRLIALERNLGVCGATNAGLRAARGEYVAFLDADDEWLPGKLEKQLAQIAAHPTMSFSSCAGHLMSPAGEILELYDTELPPYAPDDVWRGLLAESLVNKSGVLARRASLIEAGEFDEALVIAEDQDMWIRLALVGEVGFLTEQLIRRHDTPGSLMKRHVTREADYLLPMIERHLHRLRDRLDPGELRRIRGRRCAKIGRNLCANGYYARGAALVLRAAMLREQPLANLAFVISAAPPLQRLKRLLRAASGSAATPAPPAP
jgi:glycosyltransferase involved in cell wall biosynthesis